MLRRRARHRNADRARLRAGALGAGAGALAILLSGCGGSAEPEPANVAAEDLTKAEFLAEADRICFSGDAQIEAAADDPLIGAGAVSAAEARRIALRIVVPGLEAEVRAIRSLGAPPGDEAEVERIVAATEQGIAEIEERPGRVLAGPPPGLREAGRLARAYGSDECGAR